MPIVSIYIRLVVVSNSNSLLQSSLSRLPQSSKRQITGLSAGIPSYSIILLGLALLEGVSVWRCLGCKVAHV